jgi:hypothetical protein
MTDDQPKTSKPISLHPLKFEEVITDFLKIKPMPKPPKKQKQARARRKAGRPSRKASS